MHVFAALIEGERDPRITFHYVPALRVTALATVLTFILPATLQRLGRFDIVHSQGLCGLRQNVATAHFCVAAWYVEQQKNIGALTWKQKLFRSIVQPLEKHIFQSTKSKAVIAISRLIKGDLGHYYGRVDNVSVVYHGVDLNTFHPDNRLRWRMTIRNELGLSGDKFVALYVGNLQKGALPAIEAISHVENARLVFVSSTDSLPYQKFADALGVGARVRFCPLSTVIERYYAAADVFLFPTLYDPFGMVISEAMASGLPVLTSVTAGAAELIEHGVSGVVANPAWDVNIFGEWLRRLQNDIVLRENMAAEARKKIEHFTWEDTALETMRVYKQVVGE